MKDFEYIRTLQNDMVKRAVECNENSPNKAIKHHWLPRGLLKEYKLTASQTKRSSGMDFRVLINNPTATIHKSNYAVGNNKIKISYYKDNSNRSNNGVNIKDTPHLRFIRNEKSYVSSSSFFAHQKTHGGGYYSKSLETYYSIVEGKHHKLHNSTTNRDISKKRSAFALLYAHSLHARNPTLVKPIRTITQLQEDFSKYLMETQHFEVVTLSQSTPLLPLHLTIEFIHNGNRMKATPIGAKSLLIRVMDGVEADSTFDLKGVENKYFQIMGEMVVSNINIAPPDSILLSR